MITPVLPTCPRCKQTDQVQKVSSVYGLNTKEWYEMETRGQGTDTYQTHERHEAHTVLGLKLKPPEKPARPVHPGIWYGIGIGFLLLLVSGLCPVLVMPVLIAAGAITSNQPDIPEIAGQPGLKVLAVAGVALLLILLIVMVIVLIMVKRRYDRSLAAYKQKKARYEQEELPAWESAMDRWNLLYLCLRDETLFLSGETKYIRLEEMQKFLDSPNFRSL